MTNGSRPLITSFGFAAATEKPRLACNSLTPDAGLRLAYRG